jgi:DNA-binding transcriptional ArsR family regulator
MDVRLIAASADLFALMGDRTRVRLLYALLDDGEQSVGQLAQDVGVSKSAVSHALRLLRASRVVATRREGRSIIYYLDDHHVRQILQVTREHFIEELGIPLAPSFGRSAR